MKELRLEHDQLAKELEMERDQLAKELQMLSKSGDISMQQVGTAVERSEMNSKHVDIWPTDMLITASGTEEEVLYWNVDDECITDAATLPKPPSTPVLSQTVLQLRDLVTALGESPLLATNDPDDTQAASRINKESCGTMTLASAMDQFHSDSMQKLRLQESDCENVKHKVHSLGEFLTSHYNGEVYSCQQDEEDVSPDEAELLKELMELKMERQEKQQAIQERKALLMSLTAQIEQTLCDVNTASKEIACGVDSICDTVKSWLCIDDFIDDEELSWTHNSGSDQDDNRNNSEEQGKEEQTRLTANPCVESFTMAQHGQPMFLEALNTMETNKDKRRASFFECDSDEASTFADDEAMSSAWLSSRGSIPRSISQCQVTSSGFL